MGRLATRCAAAAGLFIALVVLPAISGPARADCEPSLSLRQTALGEGMLDFRCPCHCLPDGSAALGRLLRTRFGADGPPQEIGSLFVGRLAVQLPALAESLSLATSGAADWDAGRAWTDSGYANGFVRDLLNRERAVLLGGIEAAFAPWRIRLVVDSVEKVLMAVPADLGYGARLLAAGADPARRLPFDAVVWLRLERE